MKMIIIIMTICLVQVSAAGLAQKVTLNEKETPLQNIIRKIRLQTGYDFIIDAKLLDKAKKVTINVNNAGLEDALDAIFKNQQLSYSITDKVVAIEPKEPTFLERLAERWADRDVRGRVVDEQGNPLSGATIQVKGKPGTFRSNEKGEFSIKDVDEDAVLVIRYVGYKQLELPLKDAVMPLEIKLNVATGELEEVAVKGNTGYQVIDKNHPGSFDVINNELLNRSTSSNILERIQNLTPGLLFDKTPGAKEPIMIRGKNSISLSAMPLIVLDNFPYNGDINNINPNDIESVTILKDAAAASIWGARAGNGVIVLTSKKGKTDKPQVSLTSNLVVTEKTDLFSAKTISSGDFVDLEQFLFDKGFYNGAINNVRTLITPGVEIMAKKRSGSLTVDQATVQLNALRQNDVRDDLMKYFYRTGISQQNHLSIGGNAPNVNYRIAAAWDKTVSDQVGKQNNRINLNSLTTFRVNAKLQFDAGIAYTRNSAKNGNSPGLIRPATSRSLFPYADLVDDAGNGLVLVKNFKASYLDNLKNNNPGLLDWKYRPYNEIEARETTNRTNDFVLNASMSFEIINGLALRLSYQFENQILVGSLLEKADSFNTRNLINTFYQPNSATNKYPIPIGGIMDNSNSELISHQGRVQLNYARVFGKHEFSAMAGWEISNVLGKVNTDKVYGYNREGSVVAQGLDLITAYSGVTGPVGRIADTRSINETLQRNLSSYANLSYTFNDRYRLYSSMREDAANLFGVRTNERGTPLWSVGGTWQLSKESFYNVAWLSQLSFRVNYGYSGRYGERSALTLVGRGLSDEGSTLTITSVPNENLRWERNGRLGIGLDFGFRNNFISGSLEYYRSNNKDLLDLAPTDPTLGLTRTPDPFIQQNVASVNGHGFELGLNARILDRKLKWDANFNFSYAYTEVTKRLVPASNLVSSYIDGVVYLEGKPMNNYYAYKWGGLDPLTGDPQGYMGNQITKDYFKISNNTKLDSLVYIGQSQAPYFGGIRNTFNFKSLSLSFNISYQAGYYFRRTSINYAGLLSSWTGHSDYARRWQKPGDEKNTSVPSFIYPVSDSNRDIFYQNSEILMERGDHVRLEDLQLSYAFNRKSGSKLPFQRISVQSNIRNLNLLLWKANKYVDPNFNGSAVLGKTITVGINLTL